MARHSRPSGWSMASKQVPGEIIDEMASSGRRPIVGQNGGVIFATHPGAPFAQNDSMTNLGVTTPIGDPSHDAAWNSFFISHNSNPVNPTPPAGPTDIAAPQNGEDWQPDNHISASVANNSSWLGRNGISFPPPPSPPSRSMTQPTQSMTFPDMSTDPAVNKAQNVGTPAYDSSVLAFNKDLYRPADTRVAPISNWNRTGWNAPTTSDSAAIATNYSTD